MNFLILIFLVTTYSKLMPCLCKYISNQCLSMLRPYLILIGILTQYNLKSDIRHGIIFSIISYVIRVQSRDSDWNNNTRIVNCIMEDGFVDNCKDGEAMLNSLPFSLYFFLCCWWNMCHGSHV